ncbi:DUF1659 domain-containing protein [Sporolituus thermophilus]|uniref:DUF1659 domain-containing protein n=1 Tax=Sporolituus thermophilus DSM 23256 TaxID=1123285 RepID=A0A1G7NZV2_9FIRM|nr:DUF1659 domain-containing protein [Sporolituus thermophilus]SDF79387.1 Protein of unknown function [Sporolituus thermophilus DSM 23256]
MATVKLPQASRLVIKVQTGLNAAGNPIYKQRAFRNVKAGATDADVHAVGLALAGLQKHQVAGVLRVDEGELVNQ